MAAAAADRPPQPQPGGRQLFPGPALWPAAEEAGPAQGGETRTNARKSTDEALARPFGVDPRTCRRDSRFCQALDSLAEDFGSEFRTLVLTRQSALTRAEVVKLAGMARQERERFLQRQEEERSRPKKPRPKPSAGQENRGPGQSQTVRIDDGTTCTPEDDRRAFGSATSKAAPDHSHAEDAQESHDAADSIIHGNDTDFPGDPVDEGLLRQMDDLWRRAGHATRLAFLAQPCVQAAGRRLDASWSQSA